MSNAAFKPATSAWCGWLLSPKKAPILAMPAHVGPSEDDSVLPLFALLPAPAASTTPVFRESKPMRKQDYFSTETIRKSTRAKPS